MSYKKITFILCLGIFLSYGRNVNAQTQAFVYTGSVQSWTVPCGVSTITVDMAGAQGGSGGGSGGRVQCTYTATPGTVLNVYVGGQGAADASAALGGFNGGGNAGTSSGGSYGSGGGGASDIRANGVALSNRIIVAGGGGGINTDNNAPGQGGGLIGGASPGCCNTCFTSWSTGGTQAAGGNDAVGSNTCCIFTPTPNGALGVGANGAGPSLSCNNGDGGGGGGGGYYGGGAGGGYGSGAGGSSYTNANCGNVTHTQGYRTGNGYVTLTYTIGNIPPVSVVGHVINNVLCSGVNNGKVNGITTGELLTYSWSPGGQTTDTATGLSAGTYTIKVTSQCGGSASAAITVTQPAQFVVNVSATGNVVCNGQANGSASSTVIGGSAPYTYSWMPSGGNAATANGLTEGTYSLKVTDNNGCTGSGSVTITQPTALGVVISSQTNESCFGQSIGAAAATPSGGTLPYTYAWSPNGSTTNSAVGLGAGVQNLDVWDAHGCTVSATVTITQPVKLSVGAGTVMNNRCYNDNIGIIVAYVAGGPMPYTYAWTPAAGSSDSAMGLSIGTYNILVTDASGCTGTSSATITQPTQVKIQLDNVPDDGACSGSAWLTVTGGIAPYSYLWTDGNTTYMIANQCTGNYCCVVTDGNGCMTNTCVDITSDLGVGTVTSGGGKIKVYPNPTNGAFTVNVSGVSGSAVIEVYDVLGAEVYSEALDMTQGGNTTVNLANQSNGIYLYRIISNTNGNLLSQGKVVLEK